MIGKIPPKVLCRFNEVTINIYGHFFVEEFFCKIYENESGKKSQNFFDEDNTDRLTNTFNKGPIEKRPLEF